jgi:hypothetical protein
MAGRQKLFSTFRLHSPSEVHGRHRIGRATLAVALGVAVVGVGPRTYVALRGVERRPVALPPAPARSPNR